MGSKGEKKTALREKLELLRSASNSTAANSASIVVDASRYIRELKESVEKLNRDIAVLQRASGGGRRTPLPVVKVETLEKGFLINVFSEKNCPGLLEIILEAFEELGLDVLDARVSCSDKFHLEAVGENEGQSDSLDGQAVKEAVLQAVKSWSDGQHRDQDQD